MARTRASNVSFGSRDTIFCEEAKLRQSSAEAHGVWKPNHPIVDNESSVAGPCDAVRARGNGKGKWKCLGALRAHDFFYCGERPSKHLSMIEKKDA